jgi:hypothetical protein
MEQFAKSVTEMGSDLVVAKFDVTLNEVENLFIKNLPTFTYYPKFQKKGIDYSQETASHFVK